MREVGLRVREIRPPSKWGTIRTELWWEKKVEGWDWIVSMRLNRVDDHVGVCEVRFFPDDHNPNSPPGEWTMNAPLTSAVPHSGIFRAAQISTELRKARKELAEMANEIDWSKLEEWGDPTFLNSPIIDAGFTDMTKIDLPAHSEKRSGRRGTPDEYYLRYAVPYDRFANDPDTARTPIKAAAEFLDESSASVSQMVMEARKRGLLTDPPKKGQPGGQLTEKASGLLWSTEQRDEDE